MNNLVPRHGYYTTWISNYFMRHSDSGKSMNFDVYETTRDTLIPMWMVNICLTETLNDIWIGYA